MGSQCCGVELQHGTAIKGLDEMTDNTVRNCRQGLPSTYIAVPLGELYQQTNTESKWENMEQWIYDLKSLQKPKNKKITIDLPSIPQNELLQPYYLKATKQIYIGEWICSRLGKVQQNIPGGIGRLYDSQWINEGSIKTFHKQQSHSLQELISLQNKKSNSQNQAYFTTDILQEFIAAQYTDTQQEKAKLLKSMEVCLHGRGRKFNKQQEFTGHFERGELHGRDGKWQVKQPKYTYVGEWDHGLRNGTGTQTTDLTQYIGDFVKGKKTGNGVLIFILSHSKETQRLLQQQKLTKKISAADQQAELKKVIKFQLQKRSKLQSIISKKLEQFKWQNPFTGKSQFDDIEFLISRRMRSKFQQKYVGQFQNDQMNGKGVYTWFNGKTLSGKFLNGKIEGVGQFWWPDGVIYTGQYKNDRKHGKGEIIWSIHKRYRGSWAFGIRHGYGESISIEEKTLKRNKESQSQKVAVMTIKGALWKEDKETKIYFKQQIELQGFLEEQKKRLRIDEKDSEQEGEKQAQWSHFQNPENSSKKTKILKNKFKILRGSDKSQASI